LVILAGWSRSLGHGLSPAFQHQRAGPPPCDASRCEAPRRGGSIINIGSVASRITPPNSAVYAGTKAAVDAITGVLSRELGPKKIRVNTLSPGVVETEGTHSGGFIGSDFEKAAIAQTPLGRIGQPDEIASMAVFLASEDSAWLTGERLLASGGLR
jgi:3-oxoacyl-[acyl-carrier protein] reductase